MARVCFITGRTYGVSFFIPYIIWYDIGQYNFNISLNCPRVVFSISQVIFDIYCHFQSHFLYKLPIYFASIWTARLVQFWKIPQNWTITITWHLSHPNFSNRLKGVFRNYFNVRTVLQLTMGSYGKSWYSSDKMKLVKTGLWTEDKKGSRDLK